MINKNNLFIIVSLILGFIISLFYNRNFNKMFIFYFIIISIIFYVLFYFLGGNNVYENFDQYGGLLDDLSTILDKLEKYSNEEEEENNIPSSLPVQIPIQQTPVLVEEEQILSLTPTEEETIPNINKHLMSSGLNEKYLPFNINISYNAQNSTNNLNNDSATESKNNKEDHRIVNEKDNEIYNSKNLGPIGNCGLSRIYNNSDWIYGSNAWTNNPDYYIPHKTESCPQQIINNIPYPINETALSKIKDTNTVCPIEINTPWSEYRSGDSDPEPFNL
jgi:hypothetical protein